MFFLRPNSSCTTFSAPTYTARHRRRRRFTSVSLMWQIACVFAVLFFLLKHNVEFPLSEDFSLSTCHTASILRNFVFYFMYFLQLLQQRLRPLHHVLLMLFNSNIGTDHHRDFLLILKYLNCGWKSIMWLRLYGSWETFRAHLFLRLLTATIDEGTTRQLISVWVTNFPSFSLLFVPQQTI